MGNPSDDKCTLRDAAQSAEFYVRCTIPVISTTKQWLKRSSIGMTISTAQTAVGGHWRLLLFRGANRTPQALDHVQALPQKTHEHL